MSLTGPELAAKIRKARKRFDDASLAVEEAQDERAEARHELEALEEESGAREADES